MSLISDELLCAYLDNELSVSERERLDAAFQNEPALLERLNALRRADTTLARAFDPAQLGETPDYLIQLAQGARTAPRDNVIPFAVPALAPRWRIPLAAALALAIGVGAFATGRMFGDDSSSVMASMAGDKALAQALDATPSAKVASLQRGATVTPVATFTSSDGRYCREFDIAAAGRGASGVACRTDGEWLIEAIVATGPAQDGYKPVSGPALDAAIDALGGGAPLTENEERALLERQWRR